MVYRKSAGLLVLVLVVLAAGLCSASAASASHPKTLRYRIVGHGRPTTRSGATTPSSASGATSGT